MNDELKQVISDLKELAKTENIQVKTAHALDIDNSPEDKRKADIIINNEIERIHKSYMYS